MSEGLQPLQSPQPLLIAKGTKGLYLINGYKPKEILKSLSDSKTIRSIDVSNDGKYLAFADSNSVKVVSLSDCAITFSKSGLNVNYVKLSPKGNILTTWHHFIPNTPLNLCIYNVFTATLLNGLTFQYFISIHIIIIYINFNLLFNMNKGMTQKKASRWCPQWTDDESVCVRHINMELNFYENNVFDKYVRKMSSQKVANYSMTTNRKTGIHYIACYTVGVKGQPSFVRVYKYPNFEGMAIANKSFYKADNVDFKWSDEGTDQHFSYIIFFSYK